MAGDVESAYVCMRSTDDPFLYGKIVVFGGHPSGDNRVTHIVFRPEGTNEWKVCDLGVRPVMRHFKTLDEALNSIKRVLPAAVDAPRRRTPPKDKFKVLREKR